ncbi:MAG: topoisomerase DNA-binding C4 zinc finger domain-containing protein [Mogibacterium sp.]|nr:topoisomerase DNA-binding C4 zinc finger domain-containing protein [Mogibacterium sp.]
MCIEYRSKQVTYDAGKTTIIQANQLRRFMRDVRTAKKGSIAGTQFYGCSNYPKCKYTRNKN